MLQNAYLVAKIGADTAENEQHFAENLPIGRRVARPRKRRGGRGVYVPRRGGLELLHLPGRRSCALLGRRGAGPLPSFFENAFFENAFFENAFFENFANFWRARSRLYQNEILQENMRLTAFFKLYKICILLHRCNLKIFAKNRFEKSAIFVKFQQKIANVAKFAKFCQISKISA